MLQIKINKFIVANYKFNYFYIKFYKINKFFKYKK